MAREFPIANGKLVTDLDGNGKKVVNVELDGYATKAYVDDKVASAGGGGGSGGGGTTDYNALNNKPKVNGVELSGNIVATQASPWGIAVQHSNTSNRAVHAEDASKATEATRANSIAFINDEGEMISRPSKTIIEKTDASRDRTDNIAAKDDAVFSEWKTGGVSHIDANVTLEYIDGGWWITSAQEIEGYSHYSVPYSVEYLYNENPHDDINATKLNLEGFYYEIDGVVPLFNVVRTSIVITKKDEPYVTPTGVRNIAIPKYDFATGEVVDGTLTLQPYTNTKLTSDGTAFTVAVGDGGVKVRDCVLVLECEEHDQHITWGDGFSPRTDAETDFACEAGTNVYWITEYAIGKFVVARWHKEVSA